jgi:hypothetical protein
MKTTLIIGLLRLCIATALLRGVHAMSFGWEVWEEGDKGIE